MTTKDKILDAAEKLFARDGFDATSLRAITTEAEVNLAAVNYHFQSKDALVLAVFARHLKPVAERRRAMLEDYLKSAGKGPLALEPILTAFIRPALEIGARPLKAGGSAAHCLMGRIYSSPFELSSKVFDENFGETIKLFHRALHRAVPHLPAETMFWRMHFAIGSMAHTLAGSALLSMLSGGRCKTGDMAHVERQLVSFTAAGIRAEVPKS